MSWCGFIFRGLNTALGAAIVTALTVSNVYALPQLQSAVLRLDRMQTGTTTSVMAAFSVNSGSNVGQVTVTMPSGFTLSNSITLNAGNVDPGVKSLPGVLTIERAGQQVTVKGVSALEKGVMYGFGFSAVTNPMPGTYIGSIGTATAAGSPIEQTSVAVSVIAKDQLTVSSNIGGKCSPADLNKDRRVNVFDLSILLSRYGTTDSKADINRDGRVNVFDLSMLLSCYGVTV